MLVMGLLNTHAELDELGGGRFRQTLALKPIAYVRNGGLRRITNAVGATGDPALPLGVDELVQFRVRSRLSGDAPVVHFGKGHSHVRYTPLGTHNADGVVSGNVVTYAGAWDGADLRLTIGGHRLQKDILLGAGHPASFAFRVDEHTGFNPDTLTFGTDFRILQPALTRGIEHVPLVWVVTQQGGKYILTVTLPVGDYAGWTLDPTLTLQPDATDGLDVVILQNTESNFGTLAWFNVGQYYEGPRIDRSFIKFNLASLPDDATISSAILTLTTKSAGDFAAINPITIDVFRVKRAWTEAGATWNTYDGANNWTTAGCGDTTNDREGVAIGTSESWPISDPINTARDIALAPTTKAALDLGYGWHLKGQTEILNVREICSSDHATAGYRPKLVVEYTPPVAGAAPSFVRAPGWGRW